MKKLLPILIVLLSVQVVIAQSDLAFYHMKNVTPQGNHMNPTYFPDAKFYVSLPGISGISINLDNAFGYADVFSEIPNSDSVLFDTDKLLSKISEGDYLNFNGTISLFQFGIKLGAKQSINVFANERVIGSVSYPRALLEYAWEGNGEFVGETFTEKNLKVSATHFREMGIGYTRKINIGSSTLSIGARVKVLQGILQAKTSDNLSVDVLTNADRLNINISINEPAFFTAGVEVIDKGEDVGSYFISNANRGMGFDLGAEFELNDKLSFAMAINDIGKITWKEGVKNYTLANSNIDYEGLNLKDLDDLTKQFKDTLSAKFDDNTNVNSFSTKLSTRTFIGATYQVLSKSTVSASISNLFILGQANTTFGLGFTQSVGKVLTASATISKQTGQSPALGGGFAARFGIVQLYTTFDNLLGYADVRTISNTDFRIGINFLFGRSGSKRKENDKVSLPLLDEIDPEEELQEGIEGGVF